MTKQISCGIIFIDATEEKILMVHPTNQRDYWDFPKGRLESGETTLEAAIREVEEETSIVVDENDYIQDLGFYNYNKHKNLHMYSCVDKEFNINKLFCRTMVDHAEPPYPECDDFEMFSIEDAIDLMCPAMKKVFVYDLEPQIRRQILKKKKEIELEKVFK